MPRVGSDKYNIQFETTNMELNKSLKTIKLISDDEESQSLYIPEGRGTFKASKYQKSRQKKNQRQTNQAFNRNTWTLQENILYKQFLRENLSLFMMTLREKKLVRINILISQFVKTRDSSQCRSHHQKMLKYHGDILKIISYIENLEKALQINVQHQQSVQIVLTGPPQTPPVELREIEFFSQGTRSIWESLLQINLGFED